MKQLIIEIARDGTTKIDAQGFKGVGCAAATEQIEIAIGGASKKKKTKKPEWSAPVGGKNVTKQVF